MPALRARVSRAAHAPGRSPDPADPVSAEPTPMEPVSAEPTPAEMVPVAETEAEAQRKPRPVEARAVVPAVVGAVVRIAAVVAVGRRVGRHGLHLIARAGQALRVGHVVAGLEAVAGGLGVARADR